MNLLVHECADDQAEVLAIEDTSLLEPKNIPHYSSVHHFFTFEELELCIRNLFILVNCQQKILLHEGNVHGHTSFVVRDLLSINKSQFSPLPTCLIWPPVSSTFLK